MTKALLILFICSALVAVNEAGLWKKLFHRETDAAEAPSTPNPLFVNNSVQEYAKDCTVRYSCKRRTKISPTQRVCIQYCAHKVECPDETHTIPENSQCFQLDEAVVLEEHSSTEPTDTAEATTVSATRVALIDFPCQPGYLPDSRGRCREVW